MAISIALVYPLEGSPLNRQTGPAWLRALKHNGVDVRAWDLGRASVGDFAAALSQWRPDAVVITKHERSMAFVAVVQNMSPRPYLVAQTNDTALAISGKIRWTPHMRSLYGAADLIYTIAAGELDLYRDAFPGEVLLLHQAVDHWRYHRTQPASGKSPDIFFAGDHKRSCRVGIFNALRRAGFSMQLVRSGCWEAQHNAAVARAKICIGLTNSTRYARSVRDWKVQGAGGFLMANRAGDIEDLFNDGVELVLWDTTDELIDKARYYLDHPEKRRAIASAGHDLVHAEHRYTHRMEQVIQDLTPRIAAR